MTPTLPPRRIKSAAALKLMWVRYGLSEAAFRKLWRKQHGRCAVCQKPFRSVRAAHVEHSHKPPKIVRGLACFFCNMKVLAPMERAGLPRVRRAAAYLGWQL